MNQRLGLFFGMIVGLGIAFGGCTLPQPVTIDGNPSSVAGLKSLAVVQFTVSPPTMPTFPLIDAGIYKSKTKDAAPQIIQLHKERVDALAEVFGNALSRYSNGKVVFGKSLYASEGFRTLASRGIPVYPQSLDNKEFPEAISPANSYNFLSYTNVENSFEALDDKYSVKHPEVYGNSGQLAKALQVDGVLFASVTVETRGLTPFTFGLQGQRVVEVRFLAIDNKGNRLASGVAMSGLQTSAPDNISAYGETLGAFDATADLLARKLYGVPDAVAGSAPAAKP